MKRLITLGAIIAACAVSLPAMAARGGDRVDARQDRQQQRIDRGVRSGDLTPREARRLDHGQDRIDRMQRHARADGHVDRNERHRIQREVAHQDRRIYRERHDRQRWGGHDQGYHRGHRHAPAYGYAGRHDHYRPAPVVRRVYVDREPSVSLVLNWP